MDRDTALERLQREELDVLVVGGGITGAGCALDAATRGLRVGLVERADFASGTSSRSSKLIHGGLRYLQHLEVGLVREALQERGVLQRVAPFLVSPTPFVVPRYGRRRLLALRAGLDAYDLLAIGSGFPRHRRLDGEDVARLAPALRPGAAGGLVYWDARTDDARLTWTVVRTAIEHGAIAASYAEAVALLRSGPEVAGRGRTGRVAGAVVRDLESGREIEVRARAVINATGVWVDALRCQDGPAGDAIRPSKGIHLTFDAARIPLSSALLVPAPDGRYVFVIPWPEGEGRVIVGTTDEDYAGPIDHPRAEPAEIAYLLDTLNRVLAEPVSEADVLSAWAGLRPLISQPGEASKDLSRRHKVFVGAGGLVTITGGKLTTFRPMASDAVDAALEAGGFRSQPRCRTASVYLAGGEGREGAEEAVAALAARLGLDAAVAARLYRRYGTRAAEVLELVQRDGELAEPLCPGLAPLKAEAAYAVEREMALRPDDVLSRRLRVRVTAPDRGLGAVEWVAGRLARARGWSAQRRAAEVEAYRRDVEADLRSERGG